jgi:hypothetical protein
MVSIYPPSARDGGRAESDRLDSAWATAIGWLTSNDSRRKNLLGKLGEAGLESPQGFSEEGFILVCARRKAFILPLPLDRSFDDR